MQLILPSEKYWDSFQSALSAFREAPTEYDPVCVTNSFKYDSFEAYNANCERSRLGQNLPENHVPSTCLWVIENNEVIGVCDVRHYLTEALENYGGHVAYALIPSARGKGFGVQMLKLCCQYAHDSLWLQNVLVTCKTSNLASYKTIKRVMIDFGGIEAGIGADNQSSVNRVWIRTKPRAVQIRPLAVAVIRKENKILAFKGYDDVKNETFYRLIGGGIEFGEKGSETVKREFMEEFGIEPINIRYLTTVENIFTFNGHQGHEIVLVYEADLPEHLKNQNQFIGVEDKLKGKYAEFVEIDRRHKIYPEGVVF